MAEDTFDENPVVVLGDSNEDDDAPITLSVRQPSFSSLNGDPVPKGFSSLADFRAEKPIVKATPFVDSNGNEKRLPIQEMLAEGNRQKWKEMGYDPDSIPQNLENTRSEAQFTLTEVQGKRNNYATASFTHIDALGISSKPTPSKNEPQKKPLRRSHSNGNEGGTFCTEVAGVRTPQISDAMLDGTGIPEAMRPFVTHSRYTSVYRLLSGEWIPGLSRAEAASVVADLNAYVKICIDHEMIGEALYIQNIIEAVKNDKTLLKQQADQAVLNLEEQITQANDALKKRMGYWDQEEDKIRRERETAVKNLEAKYESAMSGLDEEWQTERKHQNYTKPSRDLLNMRAMMKGMFRSKNLTDVAALGKIIEEQEQKESQEAAKRMQTDYDTADQKLADVYMTERGAIEGNEQKKMHSLVRQREHDLRPIYQRIEFLKREKESATFNQKQVASIAQTSARSQGKFVFSATHVPAFIQTPKLKCPVFTPKRRQRPLASTMPAGKLILAPKSRAGRTMGRP